MPIPAIIVGAGYLVTFGVGVYHAFDKELHAAIGKAAAEAILKDRLGLNIDLEQPLTKKSVTEAVCRDVLGGDFEFTNLFDKDAVKADIKRMAIEQAGVKLGFGGGSTIESIKAGVLGQILADMKEEVGVGAGAFISAAKPDAQFLEYLGRYAKYAADDFNKPKDFSKKGIENRQRQATYRESHTRHWEAD